MLLFRNVYYMQTELKKMEKRPDAFEELMLDLLTGKLSEEGEQELLRLLKSDPSYRRRYKEMARTRAKSLVGKFEQEKRADYEALSAALELTKKPAKRKTALWHSFLRMAAAVLLILTTSVTAYYVYRDVAETYREPALCRMEVPLGSQTKVVLPDGSTVCLNSGSILTYDPDILRRNSREVYLVGEGYFEVQADAKKPFIVHADDLNVKVLGTVFNVRSYPEDTEIEVDLIKGKVNVFSTSETYGNVILSPDERLTYDKKSGKMNYFHADAQQASRWTTGKLNFVNASVPEIMKVVGRRYNVRIVLRSRHIKEEVFSGSISATLSIEEILDYIDVDNKYSWSRNGNVITVTDK